MLHNRRDVKCSHGFKRFKDAQHPRLNWSKSDKTAGLNHISRFVYNPNFYSFSLSENGGSMSPRIAIVTGGSRGIGAAISLTLAQNGFDVAIVYTSQSSSQWADQLSSQIRALGRKAILVRTDLPEQIAGSPFET
jgi:hypothetical protein